MVKGIYILCDLCFQKCLRIIWGWQGLIRVYMYVCTYSKTLSILQRYIIFLFSLMPLCCWIYGISYASYLQLVSLSSVCVWLRLSWPPVSDLICLELNDPIKTSAVLIRSWVLIPTVKLDPFNIWLIPEMLHGIIV